MDLRDGRMLIKLLEILSGESLVSSNKYCQSSAVLRDWLLTYICETNVCFLIFIFSPLVFLKNKLTG